MSFIHPHSQEIGKGELMLFKVPQTQTQIAGYRIDEVQANPASLQGNNTLEFEFCGSSIDEYINLARSKLYLKLKILKEDGTDLTADDNVALTNNAMHSIFSGVEVKWNNTIVSQHLSGAYAYRAYIQNSLNYGQESKSIYLACQLFYPEPEKKFDPVEDNWPTKGSSEGYQLSERIKDGNEVEAFGQILDETLCVKQLLLSKVPVRIKLHRARPEFAILADAGDKTYRIKIEEASFHVYISRLVKEHALAIEKSLMARTAKYFITRTLMIHRIIDAKRWSETFPKIYNDRLPKRVWVAMTSHKAFTGSYTLNPFAFHHHNVRQICLSVAGEKLPGHPMQFASDKNGLMLYKKAYDSIFAALGKTHSDKPVGLSFDQFVQGSAIFGFDTTPDGSSNAPYLSLIRTGAIDLSIDFNKPLEEDLELILLIEVNGLVEIDISRNVFTDYSLIS